MMIWILLAAALTILFVIAVAEILAALGIEVEILKGSRNE